MARPLIVGHRAMKRFIILFAVMATLIVANPARAADLEFKSFEATVIVNNDASIDVAETITANFLAPRHGIYRYIPERYRQTDGSLVKMSIDEIAATIDGQIIPFQEPLIGDERQIKIGDPDKTITGQHVMILKYHVQVAVNFFADHDELYWNITGNKSDAPFQTVTAKVKWPAGASADKITLRCLTGAAGSTAADCTQSAADGVATFTANDFLTVVVGWPTGIVTKPANYDQLRAVTTPFHPERGFFGIWLIVNVVLLAVFSWFVYQFWVKRGRDPRGKDTIIAQYDPPAGLTPGEMGVVIDERANHQDIIATLVDLAVRGYLSITEIATPKMLGLGKSKDYRLDRLKPSSAVELRGHERDLMENLFSAGDQVKLSDLKGTFATAITKIKNDLYSQVASGGYFVTNPQSARIKILMLGILITGLGVGLAMFGIWVLAIVGLVLAVFSGTFPKRTTVGVEARWQAEGFKLFLSTAERYRLQWQEKEKIFERFLPYAMAFGVAEKWTKVFAGLNQPPPDWYHGNSMSTFNAMVLYSALSDFSSVAAKSFVPPASSGSSGFGGGGFSGGGGGGGSTGGW